MSVDYEVQEEKLPQEEYELPKEKIHQVVKQIYKAKGYTVSDDLLEFISNKAQHKLVTAPAGGTKTSTTQMVLLMMELQNKLFALKYNDGKPYEERISSIYDYGSIHAFVYNKHNVEDIKKIRKTLYGNFVSAGFMHNSASEKYYIPDTIGVSTLHSYAQKLVIEFAKELKLPKNIAKTKEELLDMTFESAIDRVASTLDNTMKNHLVNSFSELKESYQLYMNTLSYTIKNIYEIDSDYLLIDLNEKGIPLEIAVKVFNAYRVLKKTFKQFDFTDFLHEANRLLDNETTRKIIQARFSIIVIDEMQDLTRLMFAFYSKLISPTCKTIAIGDSDQTIFEFNGAEARTMLEYEKLTGLNVTRLQLTTNRRCYENTFSFAKICRQTLGQNTFEINLENKGGNLILNEYKSKEEEAKILVQYIKSLKGEECAVLYRKRDSSIYLSRELYNHGIPAKFNSCMNFQDTILYSRVKTLLEVLIPTTGRGQHWVHLRYALDVSRKKWNEFLKIDDKGQPTVQPDIKHWHQLDIKPLLAELPASKAPEVFQQWRILKRIIEVYNTDNVTKYLSYLIDNVKASNAYALKTNESENITKLSEEYLYEDYGQENPLRYVLEDNNRLRSNIFRQLYDKTTNLLVCTIHTSKGLEFENVIVASVEPPKKMDENTTSERFLQISLESELRIYYVATTRQKKTLLVSFPRSKASRPKFLTDDFIKAVLDDNEKIKSSEIKISTKEYIDSEIKQVAKTTNKFALRTTGGL